MANYLMSDDEEVNQKQVDPIIRDYFIKKGALPADKFSDDEYKKAQDSADEQKSGLGWAQFAAGMGDALAGRSNAQTNQNFQDIRKGIDERTTGNFDKRKKSYMADTQFQNQQKEFATKQAKSDAGSDASISFRKMIEANFPNIAKTYGDSWANVTADDQESIFKPLQLKETINGRNQAAQIAAGQRADAQALRRDALTQKLDEKEQGLKTPFGIANTTDDAKQLKAAFESKQNFDNKINEMIQLRTDNSGGALFDRDAVARGKQLSKDLLLEYKNMAKLGVLSQSDENIINAIIPADPLAYNSPIASFQGQDPILHTLKKFKGDSDKDFHTRVQTRTRSGVESAAKPEAPQKTVVNRQINKRTGDTRVVYSDGTSEILHSVAGGQ
jgi:hypothetical protein